MRQLMTPKFIGKGLKFFVENEKEMLGECDHVWVTETDLEGDEYGEEGFEWCEEVDDSETHLAFINCARRSVQPGE